MTGQLKTMQLDGELGDALEKSFKRFVKLLDEHLRKHLFIFGERPSIADFAIAGQLIQMMKDPTPAKIIEKDGEFVAKWCEFMSAPTASGPFAALDDLKETLVPLFRDDLALFFLPWAAENLENSLAGAESFTVTLGKDAVTLNPLRSAARSFRELRRKFVTGQTIESLKAFTDETTTTTFLLRPQRTDTRATPVAEPAVEGEQAASADGEAEPAVAAPEDAGEGSDAGPRKRRRRRRGGKSRDESAASDDATLDASEDAEEPQAFTDEGVDVDPPGADDDVPPAERDDDES
jgi:hypothetical protein